MSARTRRRRRLTCMCGAVQYPLPVGDRTRTCPLPGPRFENYDLPCTPPPALSIVSQSCDLSRRWRKRPVRVISRAPRRSCALMPVPTTSVRSIGEAPCHAGRGAQVPSLTARFLPHRPARMVCVCVCVSTRVRRACVVGSGSFAATPTRSCCCGGGIVLSMQRTYKSTSTLSRWC